MKVSDHPSTHGQYYFVDGKMMAEMREGLDCFHGRRGFQILEFSDCLQGISPVKGHSRLTRPREIPPAGTECSSGAGLH